MSSLKKNTKNIVVKEYNIGENPNKDHTTKSMIFS